MSKVRTRYAPSPTGFLHIGGARTALFNYLLAKHFGGTFIVRIEDTDVSRNKQGSEEDQLDNLEWLGIIADESPRKINKKYRCYRQSECLKNYEFFAQKLINSNKAYYAYDTPEELEEQRQEQALSGKLSFRYDRNWLKISDSEKQKRHKKKQYSIRIALKPDTFYSWEDIVRGKISVNSNDIGDFVIIKQNGFPTYNFSVVIDDHLMDITHILRGEEHITNTPKQLAIYEALDWNAPFFGHLTIITNLQGEKLSKRDVTVQQNIRDYRDEGYQAEAIFNFLSLLGLTFKDKSELMSKEMMIANFDISRFSKSPTKFDIQKLQWFGKKYFREIETTFLIKQLGLEENAWSSLFVDTYKKSSFSLKELKKNLEIYQKSSSKSKPILDKEQKKVVKVFANNLTFKNFSVDSISEAIENTAKILNKNGKELFLPIRLATTQLEHGPELAKAIFLFGPQKIAKGLANLLSCSVEELLKQ